MGKPLRLSYGWVIIGITVVSMPLVYGIRNSFSVFFPPILDEFGWTRGSTAFMLSLNLLIYGFVAPVAGSLGDRWKPRKVMPIGVIIIGLATAGCGFANKLWHFYLLFGILMPVGAAFGGWPLLAPALANWFAEKRGLVIGLGQVGGGLGFALSILAELIISELGWRHAYFILAGTLVMFLLPLYYFFYYRPEDRGIKAYNTPEFSPTKRSNPEAAAVKNYVSFEWTLSRAMGTYQLWLLVLSYLLYWGIGIFLVLAHQVKFAEDTGYSTIFAASVYALFGVFMIAGRLCTSISDWIGREETVTLATILAIVALVVLLLVRDTSKPWLLYVYAACFGCGAGLSAPTIFAGTADIFQGRHLGAILGLLLTGMGVGGAIGPWLGGYIYDISGSYIGAFVLCMVCFGFACIAFWVAAPRNAAKLRARS